MLICFIIQTLSNAFSKKLKQLLGLELMSCVLATRLCLEKRLLKIKKAEKPSPDTGFCTESSHQCQTSKQIFNRNFSKKIEKICNL